MKYDSDTVYGRREADPVKRKVKDKKPPVRVAGMDLKTGAKAVKGDATHPLRTDSGDNGKGIGH